MFQLPLSKANFTDWTIYLFLNNFFCISLNCQLQYIASHTIRIRIHMVSMDPAKIIRILYADLSSPMSMCVCPPGPPPHCLAKHLLYRWRGSSHILTTQPPHKQYKATSSQGTPAQVGRWARTEDWQLRISPPPLPLPRGASPHRNRRIVSPAGGGQRYLIPVPGEIG